MRRRRSGIFNGLTFVEKSQRASTNQAQELLGVFPMIRRKADAVFTIHFPTLQQAPACPNRGLLRPSYDSAPAGISRSIKLTQVNTPPWQPLSYLPCPAPRSCRRLRLPRLLGSFTPALRILQSPLHLPNVTASTRQTRSSSPSSTVLPALAGRTQENRAPYHPASCPLMRNGWLAFNSRLCAGRYSSPAGMTAQQDPCCHGFRTIIT